MNLDELKELLRIVEEGDFQELELEREGLRLRVVKGSRGEAKTSGSALPPSRVQASLPAARGSAAEPEGESSGPEPVDEPGITRVSSPIVGTFYRSPDPASPPFVSVGDRVKVGQVLCIIEAMKLMNEIEAEAEGEVVEVHVQNGQPVQYGDLLFSLRVT